MVNNMSSTSTNSLQATTEFYERSTGVKFFRAALASTERIAPNLAAILAKRLFLTPLPPKWLQRKHAWNPSWVIESWPFEDASLSVYRRLSSQSNCDATHFERDKQHVILIHGWGGSASQMEAIANGVAERGMVPVIVEAPAHGRSTGTTSSLPQFARAIEYVATRLTMSGVSVQGLVAHSLGASAAAYAAARSLSIERLVLIAPPDRPRDFTQLFAAVFGLSESTRVQMQHRIEAQEAAYMDAYSSLQLGPRLDMPTLVVHDENDNVNLFSGGQRWAERVATAELHATQKLRHRKILRDADVVQRIVSFMARPAYDS
jgi:pimeloyl-ACP methyl ester carboxylesterase